MAETEPTDAVEFLLDQHRQIRNLFSSMEGASVEEQREQFAVLLRLLAVHETAEELVLWPAVRAGVPDGPALVTARTEEEDAAKKLLAHLEALDVADQEFAAGFTELRLAVEEHARAEEQELFPAAREHLPGAALGAMRPALVAAEAAAPTHPHSFAPESATGNLVAGPVVAIVDRVRDAVEAVSPGG